MSRSRIRALCLPLLLALSLLAMQGCCSLCDPVVTERLVVRTQKPKAVPEAYTPTSEIPEIRYNPKYHVGSKVNQRIDMDYHVMLFMEIMLRDKTIEKYKAQTE